MGDTKIIMNNKQLPKALIISAYLPEGGAGGGAIFRDILKHYPAHKLSWFAFEGPLNYKPTWRTEIPRSYIPFFCPGRFRKYLNFLEVKVLGRFMAKILVNRISLAVKRFKPDILWFIAQKKTIPVLSKLLDSLGDSLPPIHISIHDDPVLENKFHPYPFNHKKYSQQFQKVINRASSIDAVSKRLLNKYKLKNQAGTIVTRGAERNSTQDVFAQPKILTDEIKIVLGGMGQCPPPWPDDLIAGIKLLQSRVSQKVTFHAFDFTFPDDGITFIKEPVMKPEEFDQALQQFHIGYICDPMNEYGREFAATSFSTKLVTYVTHGLPFLYHGPANSTTADFLEQYDCGVIVDSHDPEEICDALLKVVNNYDTVREKCEIAVEKALSLETISAQLFQTLKASAFP